MFRRRFRRGRRSPRELQPAGGASLPSTASSAKPMDSTLRSSPGRPSISKPTGKPAADSPAGMFRAGQAGVAAGVRVADQAHEVLDATGLRVGRDRQHRQRGEQQRVQAVAGEGASVGRDQRVAVRRQGGFVQRRHRRGRAVRAGQGHRHDHAVEEALHIRAGDGRHHLRDIHAGFIAFQVRGQIGLRLVQADRHADGRVGLGQSRRLQRDEFHAGAAQLVQRGPRDAFHFRFQPGPETRRQAQPQAGGGGGVCAGWPSPARIASSSAMSSMLAASGPGVSRVCEIGVMPAPS